MVIIYLQFQSVLEQSKDVVPNHNGCLTIMVSSLGMSGKVGGLSSSNFGGVSGDSVHDSGGSGISVGSIGRCSGVGRGSIARCSRVGWGSVGRCSVVARGGGGSSGGRGGGVVGCKVGSLGGGDLRGVRYGLGGSMWGGTGVATVAVVVLGVSDSHQAEDHDLKYHSKRA